MAPNLFLSHRMEVLVDRLLEEFDADPLPPLETRTILVPNAQFRQWLLLEIAKRKGIAMGLRVLTIQEGIFQKSSFLETFCQIYDSLRSCRDPDLLSYLEGKKGRLLTLTGELTSLFFTYGQFGKELFEPNTKPIDWQHAILQKLFVEGPGRMPIQTLSESRLASVYCFGVDDLPAPFWESLSPVSIYLFSPCVEFWEDLCTDRERRRYWKKVGSKELDTYLRDAPPLLANWGKLGRETLKILDRFDLQMEELYPQLAPDSLLKKIQNDLLHFRMPEKGGADDSIRIFLTGSSRLKEIECLREEILRLGVPYHDISVMAPDLEPYVPLIEFVFADVPYRISGFDLAPQSSFRLGLSRLLDLGRWDAEKVLSLFETPSFYRKQGWEEDKLELFRTWIVSNQIKWGLDGAHRKEILTEVLGEKEYGSRGSWEQGLDRLLDAIVYLRSTQVNADLFEEFLTVIFNLKKISLSEEKTLSAWADELETWAEQFLLADFNDEADTAAHHSFRQFLYDLRASKGEELLFPFGVIQRLLLRPCPGQIHASSLHAVRFASIEEAALLPAKAVFLIGMDEGSFPRLKITSSLDLLKRKKIAVPETADRDRYFFLQALFSAQEFLRISYCHLSADEGKAVGPSLLVQELMSAAAIQPVLRSYPSTPVKKENTFWPDLRRCPDENLPEGEVTLSLSDLRALARHPWKFFLQKVHGIYLDEELTETFNLQKGKLVRASLEKPLEEVFADADLPSGLLGEALRLEIAEKAGEWQAQLAEWNLKPFSLVFRDSCGEKHWEEGRCIVPPLEFALTDRLTVRLVGEIKQATTEGLLCANDDQIGGVLKAWPEALAVALGLDAPHICLLKNGKKKPITQAKDHLNAFLLYYFRCLKAPSPLLPDWADPLLRKGAAELEKKMKRGAQFEDPVLEWVLARAELPPAQEIREGWDSFLKATFKGLINLYPSRSS